MKKAISPSEPSLVQWSPQTGTVTHAVWGAWFGPKSRSFRCVIIDTDAISNGTKVLQYQGIVIMNEIVDTCIGNWETSKEELGCLCTIRPLKIPKAKGSPKLSKLWDLRSASFLSSSPDLWGVFERNCHGKGQKQWFSLVDGSRRT